MGWLREFMALAEPPIASFGKLAALCLDHEAWPSELTPKPRSLSTLFSKLDRGKDVDWLRDRIEVQQVLGDLLKRPLGDLRAALGEVATEEGGRFVRLIDVRYARELDLSQEDLPPGIPPEALTPQLWSPSWWHAPAGSGRSLVASWLKMRGFAHSILIRERADLTRVPSRGAVFLEIDSNLDAPALNLTESDLLTLRAEQRPICIAAPFPSPLGSLALIEAPAIHEYLPELVDWINERLDGTGTFHPDRIENWMRKVAIPAGAVRTFGDALGLLGMADEVHPRSLLAKSLDELAEHYVKRRVREASEQTQAPPRLSESAFDALQECAARVLVSGENTLLVPHPIDEWTALLAPPGQDEAPDPEWFTTALKGALGSQVSRRDLRRAAKKLPPSAFQLTKTMEAAGLLVRPAHVSSRDENGSDRTLHPRWLVSLLSSRANQEALRLSASQWGRVLLQGRAPDALMNALCDRMTRGDFAAAFALCDDYESAHPELVAALEGTVIATGLTIFKGHEVPEELIESLLALTAQDIVLLARLPEPRLTRNSTHLFHRDLYLSALGSLCVLAPFPLAHLDPLRSGSPELRAHFRHAALRTLKAETPQSSVGLGLLKLLDALDPEGSDGRLACLRFADEVHHATESLLGEALNQTHLETLSAFIAQSSRSDASFERGLWRLAVSVPDIDGLFGDEKSARRFWRAASGRNLLERARAELPINWSSLLPHQYAEWFATPNHPPLPEAAGDHCPIDAAVAQAQAQGATSIASAPLRKILARGAARFSALLMEYLTAHRDEEASHLLDHVPPSATASLARALPDPVSLLQLRPGSLLLVRQFLLCACHERHPEFSECYERLMALEKGLHPLRHLS